MLFYAENYPHKTLGVVTFNTGQQYRIQVELEAALNERPDLQAYFYAQKEDDRSSGYFVKNIESVQGDERDFIIFSVGFGKDQNGKLTMNFGPLNREGGYRRLNVAITRAKMRIDVFSSITHQDFKHRQTGRGVKAFRSYLKFAELGMQAFADENSDHLMETESPFEEDVYREIKALGYDVVPQEGCAGYRIDLAIRHPNEDRFILGVECDGATYHSSLVARDRDRLRQEVLERLGWEIHRIWSTEWFVNREKELQKLKQKLSDLATTEWAKQMERTYGEEKLAEKPKPKPAKRKLPISIIDEDVGPWAEPFSINVKGINLRGMGKLRFGLRLEDVLIKVIENNLLLSFNQIQIALKHIYKVNRIGPAKKEMLEVQLGRLVRKKELQRYDRDFFGLPNMEFFPSRKYHSKFKESKRRAEEVAPSEIRQTILMIVKESRSIDQEELKEKALQFYGWTPRAVAGPALIKKAIRKLVTDNLIERKLDGSFKVTAQN